MKYILIFSFCLVLPTLCIESITLTDLTQILQQTTHTEKGSLIVPGATEKNSVLGHLEKIWNKLINNKKSFLRNDKKLKQFHEMVIKLFENPTLKLNKSMQEYVKKASKEKRNAITVIGTSNDHTLKSMKIKPNEEALRQALGAIVSAYFDVNHINRRLKEDKRELFPDNISIQLK